MEPFYPAIRQVHIFTALASGALFLIRGAGLHLLRAPWPLAAPIRYLSWTIDTVLLTAALMLMTIVRQYPGADAWLTVKVGLVVVYVVLGYLAFERARPRRAALALWLLALLVFGYIYTVARAHHPLGLFAG
ncbi:SirB2 family protein [Phenylobacterium sp.]|uniref:SirB2 family protein n=1 Tax=Phenylobacterium sp. TaxID=1871053 RepID=UPI002FE0777F